MVDFTENVQTVTIADLGAALAGGHVGLTDVFDTLSTNRTLGPFDSLNTTSLKTTSLESTRTGRLPGRAATQLSDKPPRSAAAKASDMRPALSTAEWVASTMRLESAPPTLPTAGAEAKRPPPLSRRDRKRQETTEVLSVSAIFDEAAEKVVHRTIENPWFLESCMTHPTCRRVCFPAEHATRHKRARQDGEQAGEGDEAAHDDSTLQRFGFPDFGQAGYSLITSEEVGCADPLVGHVLGLQVALHRKTSLQRYCLQHFKGKMPGNVKATEMRSLSRSLKRLDHANVLNFLEFFEDAEYVYLMYEYFPCCTLQHLMQTQQWSQVEMVNMIREICAAVSYASNVNLAHLGFTFCHILLPQSAASGGDPLFCKVFGFGLMGVLYLDTIDHLCWAPEAVERWQQSQETGGNFVQKMEGSVRQGCDSWSIGVICYSLVAKQPPFTTEQMILLRKWQFTLSIELVDVQAKSLIEGFLNVQGDKRLRADRALHHEWVHRRWRPPAGVEEVFCKIEDFCNAPLPKRLFGRFLTRFLEAEHLRGIAKPFYSLDMQGAGFITLREMERAAKQAGRPASSAQVVHSWMTGGGPASATISLSRFAETHAEDVIDGRALRHAFESLDDDGSEEVNAEELFDALAAIDTAGELTLQQIVDYIASCEGAAEGANEDHQIDYAEFCELFPVRVQKMKDLTGRIATERSLADDQTGRFRPYSAKVEHWVTKAEGLVKTISELSLKCLERTETGNEAARAMKKEFGRIEDLLRNPPGCIPAEELEQMIAAKRKELLKQKEKEKGQAGMKDKDKKAKKDNGVDNRDVYGFDSFLQDQALQDNFVSVVAPDFRNLRTALNTTGKLTNNVDQVKAHDAAENLCTKVGLVVKKARGQLQEYMAFSEAMEEPEASLLQGTGGVQLSGRGLRVRQGEDDDDPLNQDAEGDETAGNPMLRFVSDVTARFIGH
uniref:Aurora kinase n=1 Tax=Zooxanthella nutricula TaxID=1333877 RepID=A0A6U6LXC3_9DINO|eukprot:CAMPEP_0198581492 /NCGR_PEP_ID=MMETSP1462-20131121/124289_1 /TAXON_ID=1333877 /ORGANISM="Brandtodinium nutriculum, Strain RCC3387" /LENGTH=947 /DNA_ID=CAMNT_0044312869 /DNA_START=1 /DNA_END=2844 /DNA_ORIENTATION=+